jgi:hypothetical protein
VLTVDSCKRLAWLHDRMPALLPSEEAVQAWLDDSSAGEPGKLVAQVGGGGWGRAVCRQCRSAAHGGPMQCLASPGMLPHMHSRGAWQQCGAWGRISRGSMAQPLMLSCQCSVLSQCDSLQGTAHCHCLVPF